MPTLLANLREERRFGRNGLWIADPYTLAQLPASWVQAEDSPVFVSELRGPKIALVSTTASEGGETMHSDYPERHVLVPLTADKMKNGLELPVANFLDRCHHLWIREGHFWRSSGGRWKLHVGQWLTTHWSESPSGPWNEIGCQPSREREMRER